MVRRYCWALLIFLSTVSYSQNQNEVRAVNNYISFVNESIHGMLIAHRLFEGYNQTINQYVDLPDYQLNNYSNADLPDDIFEDPEKWFYSSKNPYQWFEQAKRESQFLSGHQVFLKEKSVAIIKLLRAVNQKRVVIADLLTNTDLTQLVNLQRVYGELEQVVSFYDQFNQVCQEIDIHIDQQYAAAKMKNSYPQSFASFHSHSKSLIQKVRLDGALSLDDLTTSDQKRRELEVDKIDNMESERKQIMTSVSRLVRAFKAYQQGDGVPEQYQLYGNHYHYHNVTMLNLTNRYGNGYVSKYNAIAQEKGWIKETEVLHFYKVIYPEKLDKEELATLDNNKLIEILDKEVALIDKADIKAPLLVEEERRTSDRAEAPIQEEPSVRQEKPKEEFPPVDYSRGVVIHSEVIYISSDSFDLELFDHLIKDGDRVSIMVNNEWKFKNISLETEPQAVTIHVKPGQQNFILVHADNTGYRPPNTIAIAYTVNGERKVINLKTDLENSQMVEIKYGG